MTAVLVASDNNVWTQQVADAAQAAKQADEAAAQARQALNDLLAAKPS